MPFWVPETTNIILKNPSEASEVSSKMVVHFYFLFLPHPQESSALSQSEAMIVELGECSQNMLSEAFWTPNIYLRRSSTNTLSYIREAKVRPIKN